ncbi:malonate decarboxylase subunit alpha [Streptomyces sp. SID2999]|uniref:malonate decarboxylase subunit alpha n=1 Tax=Streptomyces sp. SID2999 TaxID=2690258 RepID=UPI0023515744|nr:malonate decarboxylase subunit alpha [Streptomyces sp. SID2999]
MAERKQALAAIAGVTSVGRSADARALESLRRDGVVALPSDLKVDAAPANRSLLAARGIGDLVAWSGGLYEPPAKIRDR